MRKNRKRRAIIATIKKSCEIFQCHFSRQRMRNFPSNASKQAIYCPGDVRPKKKTPGDGHDLKTKS